MHNGKGLLGRALFGAPREGSGVKAIKSVSHLQTSDFSKGGQ